MARQAVAALRTALAGLALLLAPMAHASEVLHETFRSERLGREVSYTVYLPDAPGPARQSSPLIYLLHGAGGNASGWLHDGKLAAPLAKPMQDGSIRPSIIVMPSLGPDTWWIDGAVDAAATAFVTELMPRVEARLQLNPARRGRAIAGVSMGGFGALHLALKHPQLFCAAALVSPSVYEPLPPAHSAALRSVQFARGDTFDAALWKAANHPAQLAAYRDAPDKVAFWIVSGDHDDLGIALASAQLFERLRAIQPDRTALRVIGGGHDGATFDAALPAALGYIDQRCR